MKFIAKTRIEHHSLIITIPKEVSEALSLDQGSGRNNFLVVDVRKLERILPQTCFMQDCGKPAVVIIQDPTGSLTPYCLDHYKFVRKSMRRKIK